MSLALPISEPVTYMVGSQTHPPPCGTLQTVAEGGVPWGAVEDPSADGAMAVSGRHCTAHVVHRVDHTGVGMEFFGPNSKRYHLHTGNSSTIDPMEGG